MNVGVLGGTGVAGAALVGELRGRGMRVRAFARRGSNSDRLDVETGEGLEGALAGTDVLVDTLNGPPRNSAPVLVDGLGGVLRAASSAGVGHVVSLSIVGAARVPLAYYRVKVAQEDLVRNAGLPWTIVRSTQFHGLVAAAFAKCARAGVLLAPRGALQPVDPREVAVALADAVERREPGATDVIAGPEIVEIAELARSFRGARGLRRPVIPVPAAGAALGAVAAGALTDADAPRGAVTFDRWLADNR